MSGSDEPAAAASNKKEPTVINLLDDHDDDDDGEEYHQPAPSKVATRIYKDGTIEILDSSDEEDQEDDDDDEDNSPSSDSSESSSSNSNKRTGIKHANDRSSNKRKKAKTNSSSTVQDDDNEVSIFEPDPKRSFRPSAAFAAAEAAPASSATSASGNMDDDDGVELVGTTGFNALEDFPHARENCVVHPMSRSAIKHCPNCYCYVCDIPANDCQSWQNHCHATHSSSQWQKQRELHRKKQQQQQPARSMGNAQMSSASATVTGQNGLMTSASVAATASLPQTAPSASSSSSSSTSRSLSSVTSVLFPTIPSSTQRNFGSDPFFSAKDAPVKTALDAVTQVYPREQSPPASFVTTLRHYQKQSLAFMMDLEQSGKDHWVTPRDRYSLSSLLTPKAIGGWLCSEVGMGKTAVILALVASLPSKRKHHVLVPQGRKIHVCPGTVVLTSVSLMGQWMDECKKHAPHLKAFLFHPSTYRKSLAQFEIADQVVPQLLSADIIISSSTFKWKNYGVQDDEYLFHRVVQDESHLLGRSSANHNIAKNISARRRWCVTATPVISAMHELKLQALFLRMPDDLLASIRASPEILKKYMIRHTKGQHINGSKALSLPSATTTVRKVVMSEDARNSYNRLLSDRKDLFQSFKQLQTMKLFVLKQRYLYPLQQATASSSKIAALKGAIVALRSRDPNMRAVVFTQFRPVYSEIVKMVNTLQSCSLFTFHAGTRSDNRSKAIREFQSIEHGGAAVFVLTTGTGAVGITLTAASHVFLMEPTINPTDEIQAAGRIHRLGQTKQVGVTKFVYENSFETNIMRLHKEIESGKVAFRDDGVGRDALKILLHGL